MFYIYSMYKIPFIFLNNKSQKLRNANILINSSSVFYLASHIKFATASYSSQLCDMLAYELPSNNVHKSQKNFNDQTIVIYNFHSFYTQNRFFIFSQSSSTQIYSKKNFSKWSQFNPNNPLNSVAELFLAANWLEKEVIELHGVNITGKKDVRNLMLQYGDSSNPFKKFFPTIGLKEMVYDIVKDTLIQVNCSVQA